MKAVKYFLGISAVAAVTLTAVAADSRKQVAHRREVRSRISAGGIRAAESFVKDADSCVRRYALFSVFEKDPVRGRELAKVLLNDADDAVKALAEELLRERKGTSRVATPLPLSQNPLNDHELLTLRSIGCRTGKPFKMPEKLDCDEIEVWLGMHRKPLRVWINDFPAASYDPAIDGEREFRFDATRFLKWGADTVILVTDSRGNNCDFKFTVEILKCGN